VTPCVEPRQCNLTLVGGLLAARWPAILITGAHARAALAEASGLMSAAGLARAPVLIDLSGVVGMDREARTLFSGPPTASLSTAAAIITASALSRVVGSLMIGLNRPTFPARLFTTDVEARKWLLKFPPERRS
jgi:hypothetical protein